MPDWSLEPIGEQSLRYSALETPYTHMPKTSIEHVMGLELYRVIPRTGVATVTLPFRLDLGQGDFGALVSGFYGREKDGDITYRWTAPEAQLTLPSGVYSEARSLTLRAAAPRPEGGEMMLQLKVDGIQWTTLTLGESFSTYAISTPTLLPDGDTVTLTLITEGWNPQAAGVSQDDRDLGVMLDWMELAAQ
jgi:hypothetical protein